MIIFNYVKSKNRDDSHLHRKYYKKQWVSFARRSISKDGDSVVFHVAWEALRTIKKKKIVIKLGRIDFVLA